MYSVHLDVLLRMDIRSKEQNHVLLVHPLYAYMQVVVLALMAIIFHELALIFLFSVSFPQLLQWAWIFNGLEASGLVVCQFSICRKRSQSPSFTRRMEVDPTDPALESYR